VLSLAAISWFCVLVQTPLVPHTQAYPDSLRPFPPEPYSGLDVVVTVRYEWVCPNEVTHAFVVDLHGEGRRTLTVYRDGEEVDQDSILLSPSRVIGLLEHFYREDFFNWRPHYPESDFLVSVRANADQTVSAGQMIRSPPSRVTRQLTFAVGAYSKSVSWAGEGPYFVKSLADRVTKIAEWDFDELLLRHCETLAH